MPCQPSVRHLEGALYLDAKQPSGARYDSGDGRKGGNLVLPFVLGR